MRFYGGSTAFYGEAGAASFYGSEAEGGSGLVVVTSDLVPSIMNCAINGQAFMIDLTQPFYRAYRRQLAPLVRSQADTSNEPGEQSMDPNGLWRRSFEDWRNGAGQRWLDRSSSLDNNYWTSKGVDTLSTPWQFTLLPDTIDADTATAGSPTMWLIQAGGYVYWVTGTHVYYTLATNFVPGTAPTWTSVSGLPSAAVLGACSDGYTIYLAYGSTSGIYTVEPGGTSVTNYLTASVAGTTALGYANGRLMLGIGPTLYNITAGGSSLPTALQVLPNANWTWTGFAEGDQVIYAAANSGGTRDSVYSITLQTDGTTLEPGPLAVVMPTGETITCIYGYLGFLVIGSSQGIRLLPGNDAPLSPLITIPFGVYCAAGWGGFIWFGWADFDGTSTGLGKLSLENFVNESLSLPAYASDRMASTQGSVLAVTIANGIPVFGVSGHGLFMDSANLVAAGYTQSGFIGYDLTDPKIAALIDLQAESALTYGSYEAFISYDGGAFQSVGLVSGPAGAINTLRVPIAPGASKFEVQIWLYADPVMTTQGPTFTRFTLRSYPAPLRPITWQLPLILNEEGVSLSSSSAGYDPLAVLVALETLAQAGSPVTYQEADETYIVFVTDVQFLPDQTTSKQHYYNGLALVNLQSLPVAN